MAYGVELEKLLEGVGHGMAFGLLMIPSCSLSCCVRRICRYLRKDLEVWNGNPLSKEV